MSVSSLSQNKRAIAIIVAIVLAALATFALMSWMDGFRNRTLASAEPVEAYVAKDTIPAGTTADDAVSSGLVVKAMVPRRNLPAGAVASLSDIEGRVASANIAPGEELVAERFVLPAQLGDALDIPEGHHAMSLQVEIPAGVSGFIRPGDRIGILANVEVEPDGLAAPGSGEGGNGAESFPHTEFVITGVQVLAAGQATAAAPQESNAEGSFQGVAQEDEATDPVSEILLTVALQPGDAERVAHAQFEGELYFTLMPEGAEPVDTNGANDLQSTFAK